MSSSDSYNSSVGGALLTCYMKQHLSRFFYVTVTLSKILLLPFSLEITYTRVRCEFWHYNICKQGHPAFDLCMLCSTAQLSGQEIGTCLPLDEITRKAKKLSCFLMLPVWTTGRRGRVVEKCKQQWMKGCSWLLKLVLELWIRGSTSTWSYDQKWTVSNSDCDTVLTCSVKLRAILILRVP